jgi:hypothetical protein
MIIMSVIYCEINKTHYKLHNEKFHCPEWVNGFCNKINKDCPYVHDSETSEQLDLWDDIL